MFVLWSRKWWVWLIRGLAGLIFGILALALPALTLGVLILLLGSYLLVDGILNIIAALSHRKEANYWWLILLEGLASVAAGVVTFMWPQITAFVLLFLISFWAIITGIFKILAAIQIRKHINNEWLLVFSGILSTIFGVLLIIWPGTGLLALIWLIALYAVLSGITLVLLAFKVKRSQVVP